MLWYEVRRGLSRRIRSPLESVTECLTVYIFLTAAVFAAAGRVQLPLGGAVAPADSLGPLGRTPGEMMFAFACVFCCVGAIQGASLLSTEEPGTAVLDQLAMSAYPLWQIALVRDIASAINFIPSMALILGAVCLTTGVRFPWPPPAALAPIIMMRLGMLGIGYALGALALLARRVGGVVNLVSMALFALALAPASAPVPASAWHAGGVPGALGVLFPYRVWYQLAVDLTFGGAQIVQRLACAGSLRSLALASVVTLAYFFAGLATFNAAFGASLRRGTLSRA